jgi:hypothetical protein
MLLVSVAPYQLMNLRYVTFQHYPCFASAIARASSANTDISDANPYGLYLHNFFSAKNIQTFSVQLAK